MATITASTPNFLCFCMLLWLAINKLMVPVAIAVFGVGGVAMTLLGLASWLACLGVILAMFSLLLE